MRGAPITVAALATTAVKGLRILPRSELVLERSGARGDRRFYLVDERGAMVNGKQLGALNGVSAQLDERELALTLPGGRVVAGAVELGPALQTRFHSRERPARLLLGPFSAALSQLARRPLRLVEPADGCAAIDRGRDGAVSLISSASLAALARLAGGGALDGRRFRMTVQLAGSAANEEDGWIGRELAVGEARILVRGHVGRCIVTSRHPDSGKVDLPTLELLRRYRRGARPTEPLALGVYGMVTRAGAVHLGDRVALGPRCGAGRGA